MYHALGELLKELLEVECLATSAVLDVINDAEHELVFGIESKSAGSHEELPDISPAHPRVTVEAEQGMNFSNGFGGEDRVLGADVLGEHSLEFLLLCVTLAGHDRSYKITIKYNRIALDYSYPTKHIPDF